MAFKVDSYNIHKQYQKEEKLQGVSIKYWLQENSITFDHMAIQPLSGVGAPGTP